MTLIPINVEKRYREDIVEVKGTREQEKDIFLFTISTCMWCKMGKNWLNERNYRYSYLDIDRIPVEGKNSIKAELGKLVGRTPSFPFMIVDGHSWHSGYDPSVWEEILNE